MTLSELGSLGEFIGSIGVVVSLIYVGVQIRQNTRESRRGNERETAVHYAAAMHALSQDNEMAGIVVRGIKDLATLTEEEKYRFDVQFLVWLQAIEQAFADYRQKRYTLDSLWGYRNAVWMALTTKGGNDWWGQARVWFSPSFQKEVDDLLENPPDGAKPYAPHPVPPVNKPLEPDV